MTHEQLLLLLALIDRELRAVNKLQAHCDDDEPTELQLDLRFSDLQEIREALVLLVTRSWALPDPSAYPIPTLNLED